MVRRATAADIPALVDMARAFHVECEPRFAFDADHMAQEFERYIAADAATCLTHGLGFIMGVLAPAMSNPAWVVAYEALWWSEDGNGLRLMRAFEEWARDAGADEVKFSHPAGNERAATILTRTGHRPSEIMYSKET